MVLYGIVLFYIFCQSACKGFPQQGIWTIDVSEKKIAVVTKTVYNNTALYINIFCHDQPHIQVNISYVVQIHECFLEEINVDDLEIHNPSLQSRELTLEGKYFVYKSPTYNFTCSSNDHIQLPPIERPFFNEQYKENEEMTEQMSSQLSTLLSSAQVNVTSALTTTTTVKSSRKKREFTTTTAVAKEIQNSSLGLSSRTQNVNNQLKDNNLPQMYLPHEGVYIVFVSIIPTTKSSDSLNASVEIKMVGSGGYLSAVDWSYLPFYGVMCGLYVLYGVTWLVVSACQWRDLLRIQFWIGGVILLGMLEKAVFYAEYQSINSTGHSVQGAVMFAEVVSCLKRTLARMLVIIVSLGFGIVKPRLGPLLHRVVGVGALYFILSVVEASMRIYKLRTDPYRQLMLAEILLAVVDSFICWWIFSSLVQTTRTLRLRRNIVKLSLYRHFTNTLIFAVLASIAFMVWSLKSHRQPICMTDWKELWVDEAYWRLLFSVILLVIMILWRPTNNNQRYAFTPLLDAPDDEEDETVMSDAFDGMKMRAKNSSSADKDNQYKGGVEEDLKWVEENIPTTIADVALPSLLDSDEEIMTTKFEISKMN